MLGKLLKQILGPTPEEQAAEEQRRYDLHRMRAADAREDRIAEAKTDAEVSGLNTEVSKHEVERQFWDLLRNAPLQEQPYIAGIAADTAAELKRRERGEARPLPPPPPKPAALNPKTLAVKAALMLVKLPPEQRIPTLAKLAEELMQFDGQLAVDVMEAIPAALKLLGHDTLTPAAPPPPKPAGLNPKTLAVKAALKLVKLPPDQKLPMLSQLAEDLLEMDGQLVVDVMEEIPAALKLLGHDPLISAVPPPAPPPATSPAPPPMTQPVREPFSPAAAPMKSTLTEVLMEPKPRLPIIGNPQELKPTSPAYHLDLWRAGQEPGHLVLGTYADGKSNEPVVLPLADFAHHAAVFGASGTGKTRLITMIVAEHLAAGASALVTDSKDQTLQELAAFAQLAPENVAAFLPRYPNLPGWNPFLESGFINEVANSVAGVFSDLFSASWGPRLDSLLKNSLFVLAAHQRSLYEVPEFLSDGRFREQLLSGLVDYCFEEEDLAAWIQVKRYFEKEYGNWKDEKQAEALSPLMNKIIGFLKERFFVQSLCSLTNTVSLSDLWERQLLVLAHLDFDSRPESPKLFGGFLARRLFAATENRRGERPVVFVADEVDQTEKAVGDKLREVLTRKRSAGIRMILGTQHLSKLSGELKSSVLANCKVLVFFRLGSEDARPVAAMLDKADPYTDAKTWESRLLSLPLGRCIIKIAGKPAREVKVARIHLSEQPIQSARVSPHSLTEVISQRNKAIGTLKEKPALHSFGPGSSTRRQPHKQKEQQLPRGLTDPPSTIFDDDDDTLSLS